MIPLDPNSLMFRWFLKWRYMVKCAKTLQGESDIYQHEAVICQAEYVMAGAEEQVKVSKENL